MKAQASAPRGACAQVERCPAALLDRVCAEALKVAGTADAQPATLIGCLAHNAVHEQGHIAFRERDRGIWQEWRWDETLADVLALAAALDQQGLQARHALLVIGDNRLHLYLAMLAAIALRAWPAPIYSDVPPHELQQYSQLGEPNVAIAEDQEQVDKLLLLREHTGGRPQTIIYDDPRGLYDYRAPGLQPLDALLRRGRARLEQEPALIAQFLRQAEAGDYAVLLHSSGTTGKPKGIPLTHSNVLTSVRNAHANQSLLRHETHYAYLPMAWVGDFVFTLGGGLALAFTTHIPERQETVMHDLREVAPTAYLAAPRAWDAMLTRLQVGIAQATPFKRWLYERFMTLAVAVERKRLAGETPSVGARLLRAVGEILVFAPVKDHLGLSRTQRAWTAGEALGEDTFVTFRALGIELKQFYGQTETAAMTSFQRVGQVKLHTVGHPLPNVDVKIDDDGQILVRSGSVFPGYHDNPKASAEVLHDGWFATGDAGYLEPDGDLVVLGRVSEVVYTAGGERYVANYIENRIKFNPFIRNCAILGSGRTHLCALICIDIEAVGHWAEQGALAYTSYAELSQLPAVLDLLEDAVRHVNTLLKPELRVVRFASLPKDFDADDGEITRTRKLRRNLIEERYAALIDALYAPEDARDVPFDLDARITYEDGRVGVLQRRLTLRRID